MTAVLIIYPTITLLLFFAALVCRIKRPEFKGLDKKEHRLKAFYPASACLCDLTEKIRKKRTFAHSETILKSLCVKDNVDEEYYLYRVKKAACALFIVLICLGAGTLFSFSHQGIQYIQSLRRNDYGGSSKEYVLGVEYGELRETIAIDIEPRKYTEEEVLTIFDENYDAVIKKMLAENEGLERVTSPLNLISEYGEISISWEIDDTNVLGYDGKISEEIEENESILVNLYATFSLDDVTEKFTVPVLICGTSPDENEKLIEEIKSAIEESNSPYDSEVELPGSIDGISLLFEEISENNDYVFLLLAIAAAVAIFVFSDKDLEKKLKEREDEMLIDFTEIVSKLSLMYEAGLSIFKAWERIVEENEKKGGKKRYAYLEMKYTLEKIKGGESEKQAYSEFGRRCALHPYIKLGNLLEQNLSKGTKGLKLLLKQEVDDAFEARTRLARKKGEEASTKLLAPMVIMLVIVIVIIAVPALMTMSV